MLISRKIGKLLRGKATPAQLMMACVLGAMLGFMPGFAQAGGMIVFLTFLLVILNANLFLATMTGLLAAAVALVTMPMTFAVGQFLLDGPTQGLFRMLVNAPVFALFGFEYYATTGGVLMGLFVGVLAGLFVNGAVRSFRSRMSKLETGSVRFKQWASRWYVKLFTFVFIGGGHGKLTYEQLLQRKVGNPIRTLGVAAVALAIALLYIVQQFTSGPIVASAMQRGLERANGATVDVADVEFNLREGRMVITGLAMADPNDLGTDIFRADRLEADISAADLLRKRIAIDQITVSNATSGDRRAFRGRHVGPPPRPAIDDVPTAPDEKTIEDYIREAEQWKQRLAQAREWLERISGPGDEEVERVEPLRDRLRRRIQEQGYAWVKANHLIEGAPTVMIYALDVEKMRSAHLDGATIDLRGRNISTHPHLAGEPARITITSSDDRLAFNLSLDHVVDRAARSTLAFHFRDLPTDAFVRHLAIAGQAPIRGGTIDVATNGTYDGNGWINLPLHTTLHSVTFAMGGSSRKVDRLEMPLGVRGPADNPRITFDDKQFADALVKAGAGELARRLQDKVDDKLSDRLDEVTDRLPGRLRDGLGGLVPGRN